MSKNFKKNKSKRQVTSTQEVLYTKEFKKADKAGNYQSPTL